LKDYLKEFLREIKEEGIEVSLFVEPEEEQIYASKEVGADAVELHTGRYANLWNAHNWKGVEEELQRLKTAAIKAKGLRLEGICGAWSYLSEC
jgi:pyridoxine 5-phosphate synthase